MPTGIVPLEQSICTAVLRLIKTKHHTNSTIKLIIPAMFSTTRENLKLPSEEKVSEITLHNLTS